MSAGLHTRTAEARDRRPLLIGLVVLALLIAAVVAWRAVAGSDEADCDGNAVATVAAAPDIAPVLEKMSDSMTEEGRCAELEIEAAPSEEVLNHLSTRPPDAPDLWIPDSQVWGRQLAKNGLTPDTISPAIVTSPVVLVGGPAADTPGSWLDAVSSGQVAMQKPTESTASALALVGPRAERKKTNANDEQLSSGLVTAAQHYGQNSANQSVEEVLSSIPANSKRLVPVTEQQYLSAARNNRDLTVTVPETGTLLQKYPLLAIPGRTEESNQALGELFDFLQRPQGDAMLAEHDFRPGDGSPLPGDLGVGEVTTLEPPPSKVVEEDLRKWQVLAVPSSMLVVVDASGSMDFQTGDGTRMELAADASTRALAAFPNSTRIGLWLFNVNLGGDGVDHRVMAPLRPLDAKTKDGSSQRQRLSGLVNRAFELTGGGTGLYDTTLAAYRAALEKYDDNYFNSVVLMTDGANDDPGSISLKQLLTSLRGESDPTKPVRIVAIGISEDADMNALNRIADATGGQAFAAKDPRDILDVMAEALLAR